MKRLGVLIVLSVVLAGCQTGMMGQQAAHFTPEKVAFRDYAVKTGRGTRDKFLKITPVIYKDVVYTSDKSGAVTATRAKTGDALWHTTTNAPISGSPAVSQTIVAVSTDDARVLGLDPKTGAVRWTATVSNEILAAPAANRYQVVVKTIDGQLYAFDAATGRKHWQYSPGQSKLVLRASSAPKIIGEKVIAGFANGKLVALHSQDGTPIWESQVAEAPGDNPVDDLVDIDSDPLIDRGVVFVASVHGEVVAHSLETGAVLWRQKVASYKNFVADNTRLYLIDRKNTIIALNRQTGRVLWRQTQLQQHDLTSPGLMQAGVIVGDNAKGMLYWLAQTDGHFIARTPLKRPISGAPQAVGQATLVQTTAGQLIHYTLM